MFNSMTSGYSLADIAAATGGNNRSNGGFGGDGGAWWIIILFLFCFMGWGDNGMFGRGNGGSNGGGGTTFIGSPAVQGALTRGDLCSEFSFNDLQNGVRGIAGDVATGFANLNSTICHQQYDTAGLINGVSNAICSLGYENAALVNGLENTISGNFNASNIMALQNQNALQTQLAQCCCDTKSMFADTKYAMATDTCALQTSLANNTRDIIDNQNANTRAILDYLCQDKISTLQSENQALKLTASQQAQNAYLIDQLSPKLPVPAYQVPNPFVPYGYNNCGCTNYCA